MQYILIGKRIYVHRISLDNTRCRPYCCTTVDAPLFTLGGTVRAARASARLARLLDYSRPPLALGDGSGRNHKETRVGRLVSPTNSKMNASRLVSSRSFAEKHKEGKLTRGLEPLS